MSRRALRDASSASRSTRSSLTRSKMFCGCPTTFGAPPNTPDVPGLPRACPGTLPVLNRRAVELGAAHGARLRLPDQRRPAASRASTTSTRTCRRTTRSPSTRSRWPRTAGWRSTLGGGDATHRHPAHAPRGGRRQARPRGHARDRAVEPGRLQPRRRAAHGDGVASPTSARPRRRPPTCAPSARCWSTSASATATWRRARCAATPTSRCGRAAPPSSAPRSRSRTSTRSATCSTRSSTRSRGRPRRSTPASAIVQETRLWDADRGVHALDAHQGGRARLPLLPRAGPAAARSSTPAWVEQVRAAPARAAAGPAAALRDASTGCPPTTPRS